MLTELERLAAKLALLEARAALIHDALERLAVVVQK